jgi:RNA polymerase sigma-70 factor (family 1)
MSRFRVYRPIQTANALTGSDEDLMQRFKAGEEAAFAIIYERFYFTVYQYAKRWLVEKQDAEDITADSFVKLWKRREKIESFDSILPFLYVTVRNGCYDFLRHIRVKSKKQNELLQLLSDDCAHDFSREEIREELLKKVYSEIETMPKKMKEIFLLSYSEELRPVEIAQRLGLSVQTVSNQKTTAINLLRKAFQSKAIHFVLLLSFQIL